ncbi:hypothetical protein DL766_005613 [Monosporascus sp. MC13-8B]|uniref:VWFA domain-containing protein n=1 Tax=Monosporascus cannonballus TaxID=155416 RepID=A0ABY0HDQ2_9PEZI|nr:hypothetical protein DL762_002533 [Monosporascus cannonballus]RYO97919.1 hypothetical protein DL763_002519 [Monosporascus cannonballus]RYP28945.1 hypothetical protein DL766_005613 [Monosporascus sp. MC13-8B]
MKFHGLLGAALAVTPALGSPYRNGLFTRQDSGECQIKLPPTNGGRKVAIVLDSSGSMDFNDPNDLRIIAGKSLNKQLITGSGATGNMKSDLVTVVDFDDEARVIYPLGDPAGADGVFDSIDSFGGTWIADGVDKALSELTKPGNGPTADRSGILVLTDGEDFDTDGLIQQIESAGSAGVRVSFGFLAPSESFFEPDLLAAILRTGGTYTSFATAEAVQSFLFLVLSNGLTAADHSVATGQVLLPGVTVAKLSGAGQAVSFTYAAQADEQLVFTFESLSSQALEGELKDASGNSLESNSTAGTDPASISYTADSAGNLQFEVETNDPAEGVFQVSLNSSLGIAGCNLTTTPPPTNSTNGTIPSGTPTPTPTSTIPPMVTAGAARIATAGAPLIGLLLALVAL